MQVPVIRGIIDRRILINYRIEPSVVASLLPNPFRPKLVGGYGMAGVCLIRLKHIRPRFVPKALEVGSENAAHRIAVEWDQGGQLREGVFIPRRDTSSRFNTLVGGRLFPGVHHHARFQVQEQDGHYSVALDSDDHRTHLSVEAHATDELPHESVFGSLDVASEFFQRGSLGYSTTVDQGKFDGLELRSFNWSMTPLAVDTVASSYFQDHKSIPSNSICFDCALLMKNVEHEWHAHQPICSN
jgi:hypothetical protein